MARVGESIDARLLRLDPQVFRSIESAGASTGAMYANLGSNVSDALSGYRKAKEGRSAFALDAIADKHTKILTPGDPGYDPNLPGKTGFDKTGFIKEAKAGRISLKVITEVLNQHEKETEVKNKAYIDTYLKQEQLAAAQEVGRLTAERLKAVQEQSAATALFQEGMVTRETEKADETEAEKVSNKAQSSLIFGQADALLEQLKLVPVEERAALRETYTTLASGLLNYGESGRTMFDQLTVRSKGIIDARELKKATQAEEVRKETEKAAGIHFESFRKDLLKYESERDPEKRGILLNKLSADYSFAKYGAAGQHFSNEYNTVLTGLYSLANPTLRTKPEEFADNARKIEEFSLIGDGPVSLTTDGLLDMNKVANWYNGFPEELRNALATPLTLGSKDLIVASFPDDAVRTIVQNFVNTYTSFQGTARTPEGVTTGPDMDVWLTLTPGEKQLVRRPSVPVGGHRENYPYYRRDQITTNLAREQLRAKLGPLFDIFQNEIARGRL
jgi:hypothetical protein